MANRLVPRPVRLVALVAVMAAMILPTSSSSVVTSTTTCSVDTCLNGGMCNENYPTYGDVCLCLAGFTGPQCGVSSGSSGSSTPTPTTCTLDCSNGGVCRVGARPSSELGDVYHYWDDIDSHDVDDPTASMYCDCPDQWDGPTCKVSRVPCGEHHCFHGATCLSRLEGGKTVHRCDCNQANDEDNSLYAGQFCQYPATAHCQAADDARGTGDLFCVNEGTCRDNEHEGCDCPDGLTGFSCEFRMAPTDVQVVPGSQTTNTSQGVEMIEEGNDFERPVHDSFDAATCPIECLNGGTCRHGQKAPDEAWMTATHNTTHLNEASPSIYETFAHCVCPPNFAGTLCEHPVDTCGADKGKFLCLHGSKCVDVGSEQLCDCDQADSSLASFFAGNHCQHPVGDICTVEGGGTSGSVSNHVSKSSSVTIGSVIPGTQMSFCVNGGTCKTKVARTEPHPGCNCVTGFLGPHCEIRESPELPSLRNNDPYANEINMIDDEFNKEGRGGFYAVAFWVMFASVVAFLVCLLAQRYRRRRQKQRNAAITSSLQWSPAYKDRAASNNINIAPGSSYSDVYEEATQQAFARSSRDPMVTAVGASTSVSALQVERTEPSTDSSNSEVDDFPDDLRSVPKIDIGPPIDEDGHELHNVEIV